MFAPPTAGDVVKVLSLSCLQRYVFTLPLSPYSGCSGTSSVPPMLEFFASLTYGQAVGFLFFPFDVPS